MLIPGIPNVSDFSISILRTVKEVEDLKSVWETINDCAKTSFEYYLSLIKAKPETSKPHVIIASRQERVETILIGIINEIKFELRIRDRVIIEPKLRILGFVSGGIAGNEDRENCIAIINALIKCLKCREADAAYFQEIPTEGNLYLAVRSNFSALYSDRFPVIEDHYRMTLPDSLEEFYSMTGKENRKNFRKLVRRLERKFSKNVSIKYFKDKGEIEQFIFEAAAISQHSWQYEIKKGFENNEETRQRLTLLAERGCFLGFVLYVNQSPCAFQSGIRYKDAYYLDSTGYDIRYRDYGVGTVLLLEIIKEVCRDSNFKFLDFGWMSSDHKSRFCDLRWKEANFYIFQPTLKGMILNTVNKLRYTALQIKKKWEQFKCYHFRNNKKF